MSARRGSSPEVGRTGARFGPRGQWRLAAGEPDPVDPQPDEPRPDSAIGRVGARFGGSARKRGRAAVEEPVDSTTEDDLDELFAAPSPVLAPVDPVRPWSPEPVSDEAWTTRPEQHTLVRPYAWTRGRTHTRSDLALEALVSTVSAERATSWEHRAVVDLCATPRSVAEVSALMKLPLGVARVLISDLAEAQAVSVHQRADGAANDLEFMGRVLAGLRKL
ncbi:DUF742 domain-containing protein [Actinokineospora pegani]|uniref:DUF742 domain-containing protein n=1 Tax=Actinokineospora pegani TaxID=2654637 RepID=UPI0018D3E5EF|nr:DUF742 domain-containing protein [Actinokineospora pegani]